MELVDFSELFRKSNFKPINYQDKVLCLYDKWDFIAKKIRLKITFIEKNSSLNQGFIIKTDGFFIVNGQNYKNEIIFWSHTAPIEFAIDIESSNKQLCINNAWISPSGLLQKAHYGAAMYVQDFGNYRYYNCNDGQPNDDLNDLIFRLEIL